mmetsp:Transcript_3442/g.12514  ORF Transcript_3442/g.12514 Transcript_3442/m.12514 type:complete len:87 (-) Transcript_3442:506-766(-)
MSAKPAAVVDPYRVQAGPRTPKWMYATPLVFAPLLPLIRLQVKNPVLRQRLFGGTVAVAFLHGVLLLTNSYAINVDPRAERQMRGR